MWLEDQPVGAIKLARKMLKNAPDNFEILRILGINLIHIERYNEAKKVFQRAIRSASPKKLYLVYGAMGFMYYQKGSYKKATTWYLKRLKVHKAFAIDLVFLANCYIRKGKYIKAKKHLQSALEIQDEDTAEANYYFGVALRAEEKFREALLYFQKAIDIEPDHEEAKIAYNDIANTVKS